MAAGAGSGRPLELRPGGRRRTKRRSRRPCTAVNDRKLPPELRRRFNAFRSETDIINVVERRIWHSMEEGQTPEPQFEPSRRSCRRHPLQDIFEERLCARMGSSAQGNPWHIAEWRPALRKAWANRSEYDGSTWHDDCRILQEQIRQINDKVFRYNLIVPFGRQMFGLNWDKELDKLKRRKKSLGY